MELVGVISRFYKELEGTKMDFECTNKETFRQIIVPPVLSNIASLVWDTVRIYIHRRPDPKTGIPSQQWVLENWEEVR